MAKYVARWVSVLTICVAATNASQDKSTAQTSLQRARAGATRTPGGVDGIEDRGTESLNRG